MDASNRAYWLLLPVLAVVPLAEGCQGMSWNLNPNTAPGVAFSAKPVDSGATDRPASTAASNPVPGQVQPFVPETTPAVAQVAYGAGTGMPQPASIDAGRSPAPLPGSVASLSPVPSGLPTDPHQLPAATARGGILGLKPEENPVVRAAAAETRLAEIEVRLNRLQDHELELTTTLEQRNRANSLALKEIQDALDEVRHSRETVRASRQEVDDSWKKLLERERKDLELLKATINKLEQRVNEPASPGDR